MLPLRTPWWRVEKVEVERQLFLTSTIEGYWLASCSGQFIRGKVPTASTNWEIWWTSQPAWTLWRSKRSLALVGNKTMIPRPFSLQPSHDTDDAIHKIWYPKLFLQCIHKYSSWDLNRMKIVDTVNEDLRAFLQVFLRNPLSTYVMRMIITKVVGRNKTHVLYAIRKQLNNNPMYIMLMILDVLKHVHISH
jgi:hypothetical protein